MRQAIAAISGGETSYEAAYREFNIPRGTLHRRVKNEKSEKGLGRFKPVFTPEHEETLKKHILNLEKRLFGLTFADFQTLAFQYAEKNGIIHPFNKEVGMAGRDWVYGYLKRHPTLSFRQPENKSFARAAAFNKPNVAAIFELLGELIDKYHFPASRIFNTDETGITTVPNKPPKILSLKGKKQVGVLTSAERGSLVSVEVCFSASGQYIPPLLVFPRVRKDPAFEVGLPPDSVVIPHPSGWMQAEIFAPI